jgi:hypothetical protein
VSYSWRVVSPVFFKSLPLRYMQTSIVVPSPTCKHSATSAKPCCEPPWPPT